MESIETFVTEQMRSSRGVWGPVTESYPISASDIRRWAIASYWPDVPPRQFWDEEYAQASRWGGIVAPEDFNPFAWTVRQAEPNETWPGPAGTRGMNGGQVDTYGVSMRPGDVIRSRSRLTDWTERTSRLGLTMFVFTEREWRNQRDELVRLRASTGIRY